ncbi:MAG: flagellar hook-basal body complex protein, partial [Desulfovibrio sp.]|nr:flagellar hook-basal body complex protein [Desulfovibrio sp.]
LRREGGNLFTETRESGLASSGAAGTGTFGTTQGYSLEQSNVDLSREFVNMITTQRGFQANSKSITTVDTMLETVIAMKR